MTRSAICLLLCAWLLASAAPAHAKLIWHWADTFSDDEKSKLTSWVSDAADSVQQFASPFPFDIHVTLHRSNSAQPVPWGHTTRSDRQGVTLHVNPDATPAALREDWKAYHEIGHLLLPFLGNRNAWFAEGFASYIQYQAMHVAGVIDAERMRGRYRWHIERARGRFDMRELPFVTAAPRLRAKRQYPTMYWGGAVYFLRVDDRLRAADTSMSSVLARYVTCCRRNASSSLSALVDALDRISGTNAFRSELERIRSEPGFPDADGVLDD